MTENYKELLLKYLTGNITEEEKNDTLNYEELTTEDSELLDENFVVVNYVNCTDANGELNNKTIVYGWLSNSLKGFIALYDNDNLLMFTNHYNTGTEFGKIYTLEIDEKGQLYGIEYINEDIRFILLNNVSEPNVKGEYEVVLRNSYFVHGSVETAFNANATYNPYYAQFRVGKSKQSASYVIALYCYNSSATTMVLNATLLKINVGAANEWVDFTIDAEMPGGSASGIQGKYIYFDKEDNPYIEIYLVESSTTSLNVYKNNGLSINTKETIYSDINTELFGSSGRWYTYVGNDAIMINTAPNQWYWFVQGYIGEFSNSIRKCYIIKYSNDTKEVCIEKENAEAGSYSDPWGVLRLINNIPTFYLRFPLESGTNVSEQTIGLIPEPNSSEQYYKQLPNAAGNKSPIIVINNLYNMFSFVAMYKVYNGSSYEGKKSIWRIVYNSNNYNYSPYENTNSLIEDNALLFDTNNNLIFARNLYNYKVYNNRVISVLNVPNKYLNDTTINKETLLGETNKTILEYNSPINKNIYEDLYINNFITLNMENQNEDIYITNKAGSINLTKSAFKNGDYENAKATKMKITYDDDTTLTTSASATINNGIGTYDISVYIPSDKNIDHIDIMSEDENIVYQTITNETISKLNLQNNKYYHITQNVHIE